MHHRMIAEVHRIRLRNMFLVPVSLIQSVKSFKQIKIEKYLK